MALQLTKFIQVMSVIMHLHGRTGTRRLGHNTVPLRNKVSQC
jgi:hypothetical protein